MRIVDTHLHLIYPETFTYEWIKGSIELNRPWTVEAYWAEVEANDLGITKLREVADALVSRAIAGDVQAIKEVADRIDGKVPQALVGDSEKRKAVPHRPDLRPEVPADVA